MTDNSDRATRNAAIFVAALSSFIGPFMGSSVNVALPAIGSEFTMGAVVLGWINTAYLLAAATFLIPFGRLGDLYGRKRIFTTGIILLLVSSVLLALSSSSTEMILYRVLQGFASSMIFATALPILMSVIPPQERGKAIGLTVAAVYLGLSTGPFFGGLVTQQLGWRYIFWLNVPLGLLLLLATVFLLKGDWADEARNRFDYVGAMILGLGVLLTMYGFTTMPSFLAGTLVVLGISAMILFVRYERGVMNPLVDIRLFSENPVFAFSNLAALINYAATFAVGFILSLYLQKVRGYTPQYAGTILIAQPLVQAIFSPLAGRLSDRLEPRTLASAGMAVTAVGLVFLALLTEATSTVFLVACLILLGFGFALFSSPNTNAIMSSVAPRIYGLAGATLSAVRQIGMMFSMAVVTMMMSLFIGNAEILPENAGAFLTSCRYAFGLFALLCFGGIFASLARGKMQRSQ
jgi:EmrB/QacA subfamily drug resistance transporter